MADNNEFGTVLGPDANFKGDLSFDSAAKVLGKFEGSISSKGKVHIADGADCKASINAKEVAVEGEIEGNVEATERVDLKPTGKVEGDITAAKMVMAEGAALDGHCRIGVNGQSGGGSGRSSSSSTAEVKPSSQSSSSSSSQSSSGKAAASNKS